MTVNPTTPGARAAPSPAAAPAAAPTVALAAPKGRVTAAALAIIFGSFGAHKFYLGKPKLGVLYLVFFWAYIPGLVGWVEGMRYLAQGDEAWAAQHAWPVQRSSAAAVAILWIVALLPTLAIAGIVALLFLGGQTSAILDGVPAR